MNLEYLLKMQLMIISKVSKKHTLTKSHIFKKTIGDVKLTPKLSNPSTLLVLNTVEWEEVMYSEENGHFLSPTKYLPKKIKIHNFILSVCSTITSLKTFTDFPNKQPFIRRALK